MNISHLVLDGFWGRGCVSARNGRVHRAKQIPNLEALSSCTISISSGCAMMLVLWSEVICLICISSTWKKQTNWMCVYRHVLLYIYKCLNGFTRYFLAMISKDFYKKRLLRFLGEGGKSSLKVNFLKFGYSACIMRIHF